MIFSNMYSLVPTCSAIRALTACLLPRIGMNKGH